MNRFLSRLKTPTGIISTVAALVCGIIFVKLGVWQLSRAEEKTSIVEAHRAATELAPLQGLTDDVDGVLYRRVELQGQFDPDRQFLLDNRTVSGQPGFEVITPFVVNKGEYVLVNLGWTGHNGNRQVTLAPDELPVGETTLQGIVTTPSKGFVLGDSANGAGNTEWPVILQYIDYKTIAAKLDKIPLLDAVIVAADGHVGGYTYNWKPVGGGAETHLGYAFQWFAMLCALVILYLYLMVFKQENDG